MKGTSSTTLNAHLDIPDVGRTGNEVRISGELTIATPFGYSLVFSFRDMWLRNSPLGSRGIREVRLYGDVVDRTASSFVSGLIVQMVVQDAELRTYIFPEVPS